MTVSPESAPAPAPLSALATTCGWCGSIPHKPGCKESRAAIEHEVPVPEALDRPHLEAEVEQLRGKLAAVRVTLAAIRTATGAALEHRIGSSPAAALNVAHDRATAGIRLLDAAAAQ